MTHSYFDAALPFDRRRYIEEGDWLTYSDVEPEVGSQVFVRLNVNKQWCRARVLSNSSNKVIVFLMKTEAYIWPYLDSTCL